MRILVFGDSIAQGFWDTEGGWAARIRKTFDEERVAGKDNGIEFFNLGISGDFAADVIKRLKPEIEARIWPGDTFTFVFQVGTNDSLYHGEVHESEPDIYQKQLAEIVAIARHYAAKILFVGLTPVVDNMVQPLPWSTTGKCYSTERMKLFDQALKSFCKDQQLPVVDLFKPFSEVSDLKALLWDGVHPSNAGHKLMAELIQPMLLKVMR